MFMPESIGRPIFKHLYVHDWVALDFFAIHYITKNASLLIFIEAESQKIDPKKNKTAIWQRYSLSWRQKKMAL